MIVRAKAPLRLGLAGGGTDVSPYAELHGGAVLNATISLFARANLEPRTDDRVVFRALDQQIETEYAQGVVNPRIDLPLHRGVLSRVLRQFGVALTGLTVTTWVEAPPGSGLGSSSALVTSILGAFAEWYRLPLGEYDIAHLAYEIERVDLAMKGGRQDQYAACFGGVNFMEFQANDKVIVNPLRIRGDSLRELESCLLLYDMGSSRISSDIISAQVENVSTNQGESVEAMHALKAQAIQFKEAILTGRLAMIGEILAFGWQHKKQLAPGITNPEIDRIYAAALAAGATGGKVSGAGGGGHIMFYCPGVTYHAVEASLRSFGGHVRRFQFVDEGLRTWRVA